ncbi:DUF4345 family protein [Thalassotalea euphylliae]|uniref:DUF4345 family protein n=1 Tax=Thalassotalea euphylliae TaxID=1655234 RepID=UPI00364456E6
MNLGKFVIYLAGSFFLLYGLAFSIMPDTMSLLVTGSTPPEGSASIDFRATYGGLQLALGLAIFYLNGIGQTNASLFIVALVLISMAFTRTLGFFVESSGNLYMYLFLTLEVLGSALALFALRKLNQQVSPVT